MISLYDDAELDAIYRTKYYTVSELKITRAVASAIFSSVDGDSNNWRWHLFVAKDAFRRNNKMTER